MYRIKYKKQSNLELPNISFHERYKQLFTYHGTQVIYIKHVFDNSTFRYRAYNIRQAMSGSEKYQINYFLSGEISKILPDLDKRKIGAVVFQRAFWSDDIQVLLDWCELNNVPTAFDVDDYIFEPNCIPELFHSMNFDLNTNGGNLFNELLKQASLHYMVASKCQYLIATNTFLAERLEKFFGKKTFIIPNFLNIEQESASKDALKKKVKKDDNFTIGYFSGSPSHKNDFEMISSELATILKNNKYVNMKIVGYMDLPRDLHAFKDRIKFEPFVSYVDLQYEMATVDVNICPLFSSIFTDCKSDLKYFEAAIVGVPTVASPSFVYSSSIQHGVNGFLCRQGEWHTTIQDIIDGRFDLTEMADAAHADAFEKYGVGNQTSTIEAVFDTITNR